MVYPEGPIKTDAPAAIPVGEIPQAEVILGEEPAVITELYASDAEAEAEVGRARLSLRSAVGLDAACEEAKSGVLKKYVQHYSARVARWKTMLENLEPGLNEPMEMAWTDLEQSIAELEEKLTSFDGSPDKNDAFREISNKVSAAFGWAECLIDDFENYIEPAGSGRQAHDPNEPATKLYRELCEALGAQTRTLYEDTTKILKAYAATKKTPSAEVWQGLELHCSKE